MRYCALIPTYNNGNTLSEVLSRTLRQCEAVIVVNDGSTDNTKEVLTAFFHNNAVEILTYTPNRGKGYALRIGLMRAKERGFDYAITLDSDGQHYPEDIPQMIADIDERQPLVVGCRDLLAEGMPKGNNFANRFSNFWFRIQTGVQMSDTQTGFRAYPLRCLPELWMLTNRYEAELELLVLSAWRAVPLVSVPVHVDYQPKGGRVSHFRPFYDFFRISLLNTLLCIASVFYGYPSMWIRKHRKHL